VTKLSYPTQAVACRVPDHWLAEQSEPRSTLPHPPLSVALLLPFAKGVDPGQPFPASPLQGINSAVQVLVNSNPGELLYAGGYPAKVNFRVPDGIAHG